MSYIIPQTRFRDPANGYSASEHYYPSIRSSPNREKGKGNRKGETCKGRYRTRLQIQVFRIQIRHMSRSSRAHALTCSVPLSIYLPAGLRVTANPHKIEENAKKESMKKSLTVQDPLERLQGPNDLKGNHCKHILASKLAVDLLLYTSATSHFIYNSELLMLMKESLEIKGKT
ncbi:hypothetical protein K435DRAFT_802118 [Dendrothele bispora CBS 962.96]|uniref:Uncharacterized protein n=1 Tax=Dendrothele bispora (strain CBS 962.96) TaxID=1314807 RepID=A0A4S8LNG2_DENBC|nr:hypothetical protein K435DRAFT_802118 [Dendrothele bispora CBS 962.96]